MLPVLPYRKSPNKLLVQKESSWCSCADYPSWRHINYTKRLVQRNVKNVFHFLSIIAHDLILSKPLSEYTYSMARISGVCVLLMSSREN